MRRLATALTTATVLTVMGAAPALAHAGLMPGQYSPGSTTASQIVIVHGCGPGGTIPTGESVGSATSAITVDVPDELTIDAAPSAVWDVARDGRELRFTSTDPAGVVGTASVDVTVSVAEGVPDGEVWIPAIQDCVDGEQLRWTFEGVEMGDEYAAMVSRIDTQAGMTPLERQAATRTPTWVVLSSVGGLALAAGGAVYRLSGRRA